LCDLQQIVWKEERNAKDLKQKQSFVDLGCGNGLLVHILSEEGVTIDITVRVFSGSLQPAVKKNVATYSGVVHTVLWYMLLFHLNMVIWFVTVSSLCKFVYFTDFRKHVLRLIFAHKLLIFCNNNNNNNNKNNL